MSIDLRKKAAGEKAAECIENRMIVGIGSGSTVRYFIEALGKRCRAGLEIQAVASSEASHLLATRCGIPLVPLAGEIDITVDGADEIDREKRMIKGGGGALFREKILASLAREMMIIVDEDKLVHELGKVPLPVEITPFCGEAIFQRIKKLAPRLQWREKNAKTRYITDNGNWIIDLHVTSSSYPIEKLHEELKKTPGVIETGFFAHCAGRVVIGFNDGQTVVSTTRGLHGV